MSLFTELTLSEQANLSGGTKPPAKDPKDKTKTLKSFIAVVGIGGDGGAGGAGGTTGSIYIKGHVYGSNVTTGDANGGAGGAGGAGISVTV